MISESPENAVINIEDLKDIMGGDMELIQDCFTDFVQDFPRDFDGIKNAVIEKNGIKLNAAAHKLKGTLRYLAAEKAANAAYVLELAGKSNHLEGIEDKLETLNRECEKLLAFISSFKD
jgi:HPt (histidine-containing phosphotransfer) domain-containing protein